MQVRLGCCLAAHAEKPQAPAVKQWVAGVSAAWLNVNGLVDLAAPLWSYPLSHAAQKRGCHTCRRFIPVSDQYEGNRFFTIENGARKATPLLLVLAVVEISDVVFAVDSIPAVRHQCREALNLRHAGAS